MQAQQALSVALNKVGELRHMQGDVPAAAGLYRDAMGVRRELLAAAQGQQAQQGQRADAPAAAQQQAAGTAPAEAAGAAGSRLAEGEAACSAVLDLAASCVKLAGAELELGREQEAQVGGSGCQLSCLSVCRAGCLSAASM
jgi:hypothetical protein